ncbi:hypothetical protein ONE63_011344 [Megalurothrips usitatus]|uniref:Uncharacterized protein n=1 Tax=Megalurothrips usitatus TaxID=439358 RepID=A0AAV7WZQ1_9NEOP|nr:hypothetical protein ONE63_011344 [Megalurothrips usitatus]
MSASRYASRHFDTSDITPRHLSVTLIHGIRFPPKVAVQADSHAGIAQKSGTHRILQTTASVSITSPQRSPSTSVMAKIDKMLETRAAPLAATAPPFSGESLPNTASDTTAGHGTDLPGPGHGRGNVRGDIGGVHDDDGSGHDDGRVPDDGSGPDDGDPRDDDGRVPDDGDPRDDDGSGPDDGDPRDDDGRVPDDGDPRDDDGSGPDDGDPRDDDGRVPDDGDPRDDDGSGPDDGDPRTDIILTVVMIVLSLPTAFDLDNAADVAPG